MSLGARRTARPAATTFARNDLLFTMSDNTRMHERPGGAYACANSFSDEPVAHSRTSMEMESSQADRITAGGARRDRTDDLLLAKQALSQLSYGPKSVGARLRLSFGGGAAPGGGGGGAGTTAGV